MEPSPTPPSTFANKPSRFPLGIISDEVSDDPVESCRLIREWGLDVVELRTIWGKNLLQLDDDELDRLEDAVIGNGLEVVGISSPVFKSPLDEQPRAQAADFALEGVQSMSAQLELLERACTLAQRFGARLVRVFTFWREPFTVGVGQQLIEKLTRAAEVVERHDLVMAIENEPICIVGTGEELGRLFTLLDKGLPEPLKASVGALWDPGNALACGEASVYPSGYRALDPQQLVHVHLKDLRFDADGEPRFVPLGAGELDFRGQLRQLADDGYRGDLVLEPHYRPAGLTRPQAAKACVDAARSLLGELGLA